MTTYNVLWRKNNPEKAKAQRRRFLLRRELGIIGPCCAASAELAKERRARDQEVAALYLSGLNMTEIAAEIGVTRERVRQRLIGAGVSKRGRKTRVGWHRVPITEVAAALSRGRNGETARAERWAQWVVTTQGLCVELRRSPWLYEIAIAMGADESKSHTRLARFVQGILQSLKRTATYRDASRMLYDAVGIPQPRAGRYTRTAETVQRMRATRAAAKAKAAT